MRCIYNAITLTEENMVAISFAITVVGSMASAVLLILNGHPWFGLFAMLIACGVKMSD
jgi:hypothetical protein